jgi:hypothetical protein
MHAVEAAGVTVVAKDTALNTTRRAFSTMEAIRALVSKCIFTIVMIGEADDVKLAANEKKINSRLVSAR